MFHVLLSFVCWKNPSMKINQPQAMIAMLPSKYCGQMRRNSVCVVESMWAPGVERHFFPGPQKRGEAVERDTQK